MLENLYYICHDKNSLVGYNVFQANSGNAQTDAKTRHLRLANSPSFTEWKKADSWIRENLE